MYYLYIVSIADPNSRHDALPGWTCVGTSVCYLKLEVYIYSAYFLVAVDKMDVFF